MYELRVTLRQSLQENMYICIYIYLERSIYHVNAIVFSCQTHPSHAGGTAPCTNKCVVNSSIPMWLDAWHV